MPDTDKRAAYIEGLRQFATALESHPEIPLPRHGDDAFSPLEIPFYGNPSREEMAAAVRALPCSFAKQVSNNGQWLELNGQLGGGLHIQLYAARDAVCTRRVVGIENREVEETVQAAVTRKVTKPVEIVEWDCYPILAKPPAATCPACGEALAEGKCPQCAPVTP